MHATETRETSTQPGVDRWAKAVYATPAYKHLVRQARRTRDALSDVIEEQVRVAKRAARRHRPFRRAAMAFAAGAALGALAAKAALSVMADDA